MPGKIKNQPNGSSPENDPNHFEGKPGPAPTGLKRKIQIPFMVSEIEFEYLRRMAGHIGISVSEFMRGRIFPMSASKFKDNLKKLRDRQGGNIP